MATRCEVSTIFYVHSPWSSGMPCLSASQSFAHQSHHIDFQLFLGSRRCWTQRILVCLQPYHAGIIWPWTRPFQDCDWPERATSHKSHLPFLAHYEGISRTSGAFLDTEVGACNISCEGGRLIHPTKVSSWNSSTFSTTDCCTRNTKRKHAQVSTSHTITVKVESQSDTELENKKRSTYHPIKIEEKNSDSERDKDIIIVPPSKLQKRAHNIDVADNLEYILLFCASVPIPASKQLEPPPLSSSFEPVLANHQYHDKSAPSPYMHHDTSVDIFEPPFNVLDNDYDAHTDFPSSPTLPPSSQATSSHSSDDDCLSTNGALSRGLGDAPHIPARYRSFQCHSSRIYQPKFHSCHRILIFW